MSFVVDAFVLIYVLEFYLLCAVQWCILCLIRYQRCWVVLVFCRRINRLFTFMGFCPLYNYSFLCTLSRDGWISGIQIWLDFCNVAKFRWFTFCAPCWLPNGVYIFCNFKIARQYLLSQLGCPVIGGLSTCLPKNHWPLFHLN